MDPTNLTEDQVARLRACKSEDELRAFAEEQGIELTDDQLGAVSGGHAGLYIGDLPDSIPAPNVVPPGQDVGCMDLVGGRSLS